MRSIPASSNTAPEVNTGPDANGGVSIGKIEQKNEGGGHNIVGPFLGPTTIHPPRDPNLAVRTYNCAGYKRVTGPGGSGITSTGDEVEADFNRMVQLREKSDWQELLRTAEARIVKTPDWLTPYLLAGVALTHLGQNEKAKERIEYFEKTAVGNFDYAPCEQFLIELRRP